MSALFWLQLLVYARQVCSGDSRGGAWDSKVQRYGSDDVCVSITAVPIIKLFARGEGDTGGHVLRGTTSRGLCGLVCPSRTNERGGEGDCVKDGGGGEGERERERALMRSCIIHLRICLL